MATVPDDHPYIAAVLPSGINRVRFITGEWEPSPLLSSARTELSQLDVVHVHFGYESLTDEGMQWWIGELQAAGTTLVVTVHDLRNPHQHDRASHDRHLSALLAAAGAVITLTDGAAADIAASFGVRAQVLAHPSLVNTVPEPDAEQQPVVVGVHLKSLRANIIDPDEIVRAAAAGAQAAGASLRVDAHPGVSTLAVDGAELRVHPRFSDAELLDYLQGLSVSVLPYRFGSHSGWLELCRDLGVAAVVPDCGYYAEQWSAAYTYGNNDTAGLDAASLARAITAAVRDGRPTPADRGWRDRQRAAIQASHADIYRRVAAQ